MARNRLLATLLSLLLLGAALPASSPAEVVSDGSMKLRLTRGLDAALRANGVELHGRGGAWARGRFVTVPVAAGVLRPSTGRGYLTLGGTIEFAADGGTVKAGDLALNTGKGLLTARLGGEHMRLARVLGVRPEREGFALHLGLRKLVLTAEAARALGSGLGVRGVFRAGRGLGSARVVNRFEEVTVLGGTIYLTLDPGFRAKLGSLGVEVIPFGDAWVASHFAFTKLRGSADLDFESGAVSSEDGLRLIQAGTPSAEVALLGITLDLGSGAAVSDIGTQPQGRTRDDTPFASVRFGIVNKHRTGTELYAPSTPATLSADLAATLNEMFAERIGRAPAFTAGEPLGQFAVSARTRGRP